MAQTSVCVIAASTDRKSVLPPPHITDPLPSQVGQFQIKAMIITGAKTQTDPLPILLCTP